MSSTHVNRIDTEGDIAAGNNAFDPLSITSTVGTWVAAFLAVVALLGVVPVYFAIKTNMSDKIRALKSTFPHITGAKSGPLIPDSAARGVWNLQGIVDFQNLNSGWAKLCKLIESYSVVDTMRTDHVNLGITRDGPLEIANSRTALVAHKHWILLLGLLGRYGRRHDGGVLQPRGILRTFPEERAAIMTDLLGSKVRAHVRYHTAGAGPIFSHESNSTDSLPVSDESSDIDLIPPSGDSGGSSHTAFTNTSLRENHRRRDKRFKRLRMYPQLWDGSTIVQEEKPMTGITGTMQFIGSQQGSQLTSIVFCPHTTQSIFQSPDVSKPETSPLCVLYWLAHSFIPCTRGLVLGGQLTVICLETPSFDYRSPYCKLPRQRRPTVAFYRLETPKSLDIPLSVRNRMSCLGMRQTLIRHFVQVESPYPDTWDLWQYTASILAQDRVLAQRYRAEDDSEAPSRELLLEQSRARVFSGGYSNHQWRYADDSSSYEEKVEIEQKPSHELSHDPISIFSDENWVLIPANYSTPWQFYRKPDIEAALEALFSLEWDLWGYLIWRKSTQFWRRLLRNSTAILRQRRFPVDDQHCEVRKRHSRGHNRHRNQSWPYSSTRPLQGKVRLVDGHLDTSRHWRAHRPGGEDFEEATDSSVPPKLVDLMGEFTYDYTTRTMTRQFKHGTQHEVITRSWKLMDCGMAPAPGAEPRVSLDPGDVIAVGLWAAVRATLWLSSQDSKPLLEFVNELDHYVYVV